jgi:cytochrome c biogenesis protein CcmG, thiol:disulfide interchange protein DsbE
MTESITSAAPVRRGVPMWAQIIVWAFLVGLLVLVAMTLNLRQQDAVHPGSVIENFTLPLYSGYEYEGKSQVDLKDFRGKVVVINFWASWCKPCEQEAAELQRAWEEYEPTGEVMFLGVDYVDTPRNAMIYLKKFGITYPNGEDLNVTLKRPISDYFRIKGVPETYFVDRDGVLKYVQVGPFSSIQQIRNIIDPILAE